MEVPQNLLKLLSTLVEEPIAAPFPAIMLNLERLNAQRNALCGTVGRSRECLLARESNLIAKLIKIRSTAAKPKTSFDASGARVHCLNAELARFKVTQDEEV